MKDRKSTDLQHPFGLIHGTTSKLILLDSIIGPSQQPSRRCIVNSYIPGVNGSYQDWAPVGSRLSSMMVTKSTTVGSFVFRSILSGRSSCRQVCSLWTLPNK